MPTTYTPLLGFSLPTQGELSGTWGDVTNTSLTNLADTAIAGTTTLNADADVTLTSTVGSANQARSAILYCSGARTALRNITAPASSKKYTVINDTSGGFDVVIRGAGPTAGVLVPFGAVVEVAWYGTDFIAVGAPATAITGVFPISKGGTGASTAGAALTNLGAAPLASPTFTGVPAAPTPGSNVNTTQLVNGQWVNTYFAQSLSPAFTGTPTTPTAAPGTNTTQIASTAYVRAAIAGGVVGSGYAIREVQTATGGQTVFNLVNTYTPGTNAIWVYINGVRQFPGAFTETNFNTVTLSAGVLAGDQLLFEIGIVTAGTAVAASATSFNPLSWNTATEVQTAIANVYPAMAGQTGKFLTNNGTAQSWADPLPSQTGNALKVLTTNGTVPSWGFAGIAQVTTATTATTLTNSPTLLQITPASYGVTVTLPDATTCSLGGPLHCIDNRGAYPVRVVNSAGVLKGFVFAGVTSNIWCNDNTTAAGVWAIENGELVGASAQLLTTRFAQVTACIAIDSNREYLQGSDVATSNLYGVVYDKSTNTFGAATLIRTAAVSGVSAAVLSAANQILAISCPVGTTSFEAVTLSISGTTITVNTAATDTLSATLSAFADGCGLIAVGSSFVTSYTVATPAAQIRALSISGTTVTIGAATVLDGTAGGLIAAAANHVIAVSTATTHLYTKPYLVSGSTLTAGTGTDSSTYGTVTLNKAFALGTRWAVLFLGSTSGDCFGGVVSLNATGNGTTTISVSARLHTNSASDAIVVGSNKVLSLSTASGDHCNILTDTAGTASAGTAITLDSQTTKVALYANGASVVVQSGSSSYFVHALDCSGSSPVLTRAISRNAVTNSYTAVFDTSNSVLRRGTNALFGAAFVQNILPTVSSPSGSLRVMNDVASLQTPNSVPQSVTSNRYRGKSDSERWAVETGSFAVNGTLVKLECVA